MEADDRSRRDIRKAKQGFPDRFTHISIDRYCCQRLASLCQSSLVIFRDVDSCFTEESTHSADYPRNIVVRQDYERITWLDIDVKSADSRQPRERTRRRRAGNGDLLHPATQPYFNRIRMVLR